MPFSGRILASLAGILCVLNAPAVADQVSLKDGSVLHGKIQGLSESSLQFIPSFGGEVALPWTEVSGISSDAPVAVGLVSGDRLVGILNATDGQQYVHGTALGDVPIVLTDVSTIGTPTAAGEAGAPTEESMAAMKADYETKLTDLEAKQQLALKDIWSGRAELGVNGQSGNKERIDVRLGIDLNRNTERERLNIYLKGQYAETNSEKSANEVMGGTRLEVDFTERTYAFGKVDLEYDKFEDLDLRATLTAGIGHFLIKREKLELKGWVGAGYEHETFTVDPEPLPEATTFEDMFRQAVLRAREENNVATTVNEAVVELGYGFRKDYKENFRFKHGLTYYPSLNDPTAEYRLAADTAFEFPLGKEPNWSLRTGVRHEYDAEPRENIDNLDTTYYLNLGYNW